MRSIRATTAAVALLVNGAATAAQERIFVDQWSPTESVLYIADADGADPRKLVAGSERDYNASFSFDDEWVVFTSERHGSADIFRVRADGMGLERLTDHSAFDDQAALSPDGRALAFVSTRDRGSTDIYLLDVQTGEVRNLTDAPGGDYRPSWSPDGRWLAFSSERGKPPRMAAGRWEHIHEPSVYVMRADGGGVRRLTADGQLAGSPRWSADGRRVVFYELAVEDTFRARGRGGQARVESRVVSVDVDSGERTEHASGPGLKLSPQFVAADRVGWLAKSGPAATIAFSDGVKGAAGDIGNPSWSHDGRRVVYQQGPIATIARPRAPGEVLAGRDPGFELRYASGFPAVSPDGRLLVVSERTGRGRPDDRTGLAVWGTDGDDPRRIFRGDGSVMAPQWSPDGEWIVFGAGGYFGARRTRPGRVMVVRPDGSDPRAVTEGPLNAGFPSFSPDGGEVVYRVWGDTAEGLRIVDLADGTVRTLTTGYDNFPAWSPAGDLIVFSRLADGDFDIFSIRPDGTDLRQLTTTPGGDSHPAWSPDGQHILFSSSRHGFKDEAPMHDIPQPYGELFIMRADGSEQRALTDNRWEEGTPAWVPTTKKAPAP